MAETQTHTYTCTDTNTHTHIHRNVYTHMHAHTHIYTGCRNMLERWNSVPREDIKVSNFSWKVLDAKYNLYSNYQYQ